jgi:uncharacterized protein involved in exopolysaccharide biosynthesis
MPVIWLTALTLGAVVGGSLALTNPLTYTATGWLLGVGTDETAAQDEIAIIRNAEVMRGVVDRLGLSSVAPGCVEQSPAMDCAERAVSAALQTRIAGDPNGIESGPMLRLTATHADPLIAVAMLDAAVAIDRKLWREAHLGDRVGALDPQLAAAQSALDDTLAEVARIRAQAHVTNIVQDLALAAADTAAIIKQDGDLRLRQAASGAELQAARNALQTAPETVLDSREVSSGDPGQDSRTLLLQLKLQRAHMAQLYARDYPGLAELDHKIEMVETTMKAQAKSTVSVTRDVRNPVITVLGTRMATLGAEGAGLVQQRQELQRQLSVASSREAGLRDAERRLAMLQQRQNTQEAVVRQLSLSVASLRSQDSLNVDHLSQRRLLQRPEAVAVPWTGVPAAVVGGVTAGLIYGIGLSILAWRRRALRGVVQASRRVLERLEHVWTAPSAAAAPQIMAVPLPPSFGGQPPVADIQPTITSTGGTLARELEAAASMGLFAFRRERDIKSLGFDGQATGLSEKPGG